MVKTIKSPKQKKKWFSFLFLLPGAREPWIRVPGWKKNRIQFRDEQPESFYQELRSSFLGQK
jgi:hypothetical protein